MDRPNRRLRCLLSRLEPKEFVPGTFVQECSAERLDKLAGLFSRLHAERVLTRDAHDGNVILTDAGDLMFIDFGKSHVFGNRLLDDAHARAVLHLHQDAAVGGSLPFLPTELHGSPALQGPIHTEAAAPDLPWNPGSAASSQGTAAGACYGPSEAGAPARSPLSLGPRCRFLLYSSSRERIHSESILTPASSTT